MGFSYLQKANLRVSSILLGPMGQRRHRQARISTKRACEPTCQPILTIASSADDHDNKAIFGPNCGKVLQTA
jgi:hypothetical protein